MPAKKIAADPTEPTAGIVCEFSGFGKPQFDDEKLLVTGAVLFGPAKLDGNYFVTEKGSLYAPGFHQSVVDNADGALGYPRHPVLRDGNWEERDAGDALYTVQNPRLVTEQGIPKAVGDLQFFPDATKHYNRMKRAPKRLGLSIFGPSITRFDAARGLVVNEKIDAAHNLKLTVDFGEAPSATKNVFEMGHRQTVADGPTPNNDKENVMEPDKINELVTQLVTEKIKPMQEKLTAQEQVNAALTRRQLVSEKLAGKPQNLITESLVNSLSVCADDKMDGIVKEHFEKLGRLINPVTDAGADGTNKGQQIAATGTVAERVEIGRIRGVHALVAEMGAGGDMNEARRAKMSERFCAEFGHLADSTKNSPEDKQARKALLAGWNPRRLMETMFGTVGRGVVREAAVLSTSFQNINTLLLGTAAIARYEILTCTKFVDSLFQSYLSTKELESWPGYDSASASTTAVSEGAEYPDATTGEKWATDVRWGKYGAKVRVTEEEVLFDQPGQVLMRLNHVVDFFGKLRAVQIMRAFYDLNPWECYRPDGSQTPLWNNAQTLLNTPLVDYETLYSIREKLRAFTDENANRIDANAENPLTLLVPTALENKADLVTGKGLVRTNLPTGTQDRGMDRQNPFSNTNIIMSTILDDLNEEVYSDPEGSYFASAPGGIFDQFLLKKHFPFGVEQLPPAEANRVSTDTIGGVRVRYKERLFALDNKRVVRVIKAATT